MEIIHERVSVVSAIWLVIALSAAGVLADTWLKIASTQPHPTKNVYFWLGALLYGSTAFAWVHAMRHLKLASLGAIYAVATVLMLTVIGVVVFRESLRPSEWLGLFLALISVTLLTRHA